MLTLECTDAPVVSWSQLVPFDSVTPINEGNVVELPSILQLERTKRHPLKPWIRGKRLSAETVGKSFAEEEYNSKMDVNLGFNWDMKGWHYNWVSNKHCCDDLHCLQVYIFKQAELQNSQSTVVTASELHEKVMHNGSSEIPVQDGAISDATEILKQLEIDNSDSPNLKLQCVSIIRSPKFQVFCRRRRRFSVEPTAPVEVKSELPDIKRKRIKEQRRRSKSTSEIEPVAGSSSGSSTPASVINKKSRSQSFDAKDGVSDVINLLLGLSGSTRADTRPL